MICGCQTLMSLISRLHLTPMLIWLIEIDIWLTSRIAQLPRPRELGPFVSSDTQKIWVSEETSPLRGYQELAEGSIGSLDRNDQQPVGPLQSTFPISTSLIMRDASLVIATVDTCITSFVTCGLELIAACEAPHLHANHYSSVAFYLDDLQSDDFSSQMTCGNADQGRLRSLTVSRNGWGDEPASCRIGSASDRKLRSSSRKWFWTAEFSTPTSVNKITGKSGGASRIY